MIERMTAGDRRALAKLITMVESRPKEIYAIMSRVAERSRSVPRLGVTGPPGAGKSTLIDELITAWRKKGQTVGAVVVDPSSPFSGGAVLGDRIRMQRHAMDPGVFIRSLGSRGSHGGISRATMEIALLMDAFGLDQLLVETVGVGQTELDIIGIADTTVVVLVPEAGDTIQTLKAGLMEIGDIFVINKADRDGADRIAAEVRAMLELQKCEEDDWKVPVVMTVAKEGRGIAEFMEHIEAHRCFCRDSTRHAQFKRGYFQRWLVELILAELADRIKTRGPQEAAQIFEKVAVSQLNPYEGAAKILADKQLLESILIK